MKFPIPDKSEPLVDVFNFEEENTIHYVGGYVIAVLKKYQSDKEIIVGLNQLTNNNTEINAAWVQEVHRLTMITVQAQDVFMSIEANIKSKLTRLTKWISKEGISYKMNYFATVMSSLVGA